MASYARPAVLKECAIHVKFDTTRTLYIIDQTEKSRLYEGLYFFLNAKYTFLPICCQY